MRWQPPRKAGDEVGYHRTGGLTLAFTSREAEILEERMCKRREAGAPIEQISLRRAAELEPAVTPRLTAASYCAEDGYANSSLTGAYYRQRLREAEVFCAEFCPVERIEAEGRSLSIQANGNTFQTSRVLLATGAWAKRMSEQMGFALPVHVRINTVSVTERMPRVISHVIGHATGLLTMKQSGNGTTLIGGGWQGKGTPETRGEVATDTLVTNLRLAQYAVPELANARLVRTWTGFEAHVPDFYPLAGRIPGFDNIYVLCCVRGGYTIGPYIGRLMGDFMCGRETELPLFDPARFSKEAIHGSTQ